ncbi:MAG: DUF349 domain-containing protein [Bacteroidota bacterium]|nr:DUF349 domain-containing protein [Bacteroidota bacterium]MEC8663135.1 DUF349 domain-containing protein [Bacteroidota bacterium]
MRSELLQRIQTLLENEDLEAIRKDVRTDIESFRALIQEDFRTQRDAWAEQDHEPDEKFQFQPSAEEIQFNELVDSFKSREKAWRQRIAEEQRANLEVKTTLIDELKNIIQEEENIGAAFARFNEVREKWEATGDVPGDRYKEVHDEYHRLRDEFFYNINIYKQLQEHDLQKNLTLKEGLIAQAQTLATIEDLKEREALARSLQKQWFDVGPSPRETFQQLADTFFGLTRETFDAVKTYYDGIRAQFEVHKGEKEALISALQTLLTEDIDDHKGWQAATKKVVELQATWKATGFAGKEHNEALWSQFREAADVFFERKQVFYDRVKASSKVAKEKKLRIIEQAEGIQNSTDWKATTDALIRLQKEWKAAGPCAPGDEHKLWKKFRAAQDVFFNAKKAQFADRGKEEKANLALKMALLEKIEGFAITENRNADLETLKAFSTEWREIGFIPRKNLDSVMNRFRQAMDKHYDALSAARSERSVQTYTKRVEQLASGDNRDLRREQNILRDKISRLQQRITSTEENMERFTGKGAESIREQAEKTLKNYRREIDEIKAKLKMLREASNAGS